MAKRGLSILCLTFNSFYMKFYIDTCFIGDSVDIIQEESSNRVTCQPFQKMVLKNIKF